MQTFRDLERHLGLVPAATAAALSEVTAGRGREEALGGQSPRTLEGLSDTALIQSTAASNAIEGIVAPTDRIAALVRDQTAPENRSEEEIAGYRRALETIHSSAEHIPVKPSIVQQFHRDIYSLTSAPGGHFKNAQNEVARFDKSGRKIAVIFEGTSPAETPAAMDELHERFNQAFDEGRHAPLLLAGAYVFDLLMIHPFNDGNGRVSRLLTLLLLYKCGHRVGRFVSFEKIVEESKEAYYASLERSTAGWDQGEHDIWPWLNYFLGVLSASYKELEAETRDAIRGRGSKAKRIREFVHSRAADTFTLEEVQRALPDISAEHIRAELRKLRDSGVVESPGRGRKEWRRVESP
jgi:Fic family protein